MAERKRILKKRPDFRLRIEADKEENDLKKIKAQAIKDLEESKEKEREWYDNELDKNLKKQ